MQNEVLTNREKLILFDNCATKLGRRKREIRRNQYTGEELNDFRSRVHEIVRELDENDIYEIEETFLERIAEESSDEQIRQIYHGMLTEMRRVLRLYKNELGETIDNLHITEEEYGRFLKHGDSYYYDATEIIISGQPERLLCAFFDATDNKLSVEYIENMDERYNVASRRIYRLRKILRKATGKDLIISANVGEYRGYKLLTS